MRTGMVEREQKFGPSLLFPPGGGRGVFVTCWGVTMEPSLVQTVSMEHSILQTGSPRHQSACQGVVSWPGGLQHIRYF